MTASRSCWTALFLNAEPQTTGWSFPMIVARRRAALSSAADGTTPSRYLCIRSSSVSAIASIAFSRQAASSARCSAGTSTVWNSAPRASSLKSYAISSNRSMTPRNVSAEPHGRMIGTGLAPSLEIIISTQRSKSAPTRSILLTNAMRGTP